MKNWVCPESGDMYDKPGPCPDCGVTLVPLEQELSEAEKIAPPQRTWVGLTEQEHTELAIECGCLSADWVFYGAAVERKIKEKNEI